MSSIPDNIRLPSNMSPDTVSLLFPDRPIRPLPKRRLRERISPETAGSIRYPPSTHDSTPLFFYPQHEAKIDAITPGSDSTSSVDTARRHEAIAHLPSGRASFALARENEDNAAWRNTVTTRTSPKSLSRVLHPSQRLTQNQTIDLQPPPSVTSSADGYESFENTNNKKKRKIPTVGDAILSGAHSLNTEISSLAISTQTPSPMSDPVGDQPQQPNSRLSSHSAYATSNQDLSGSGRGRLSRSRNTRSPLRSLPDGNGIWAGRPKMGQSSLPLGQGNSSIISNAIANAEKLPFQGQENMSLLLQRSTAAKTMPATTQFTFTCESQVPGAVQWPGQSLRHGAQAASGLASATNTNPSANQDESSKASSRRSANLNTKSRRRLEKELLGAARNRRQLATSNYYHNPPKLEDVWMCEFCEYERIFGEPPRTLIRDYEIKDRRHRREEADRKRLLEKAKAKSRKGKKSGKAASKGSQPVNCTSDQLQEEKLGEEGAPQADTGQNHSTQSEGEYDDLDEDYPRLAQEHVNGVGTRHNEDLSLAGAKT